MKLNCIVIDDSSIQRLLICKLVDTHPNLSLLGNYSNAFEARKFLDSNHKVDLIFLDVEMPDFNGFEFVDSLQKAPQIIFITSKAEYAVKAFDYEATDYLQKPMDIDRFNASIRKAINQYLFDKKNSNNNDKFIVVKSNLKKVKIYFNRIKWIEAYGDYIKIVTDSETNLVLTTMKLFENELDKFKFLRVHKSFIINIDKVDRFDNKFAEIGTTKIPLSRNKRIDLSNALEVI